MRYPTPVNNSRTRSQKARAQPVVALLLAALCLFLNVTVPAQSVQALSRPADLPDAAPGIGEPVAHVHCAPGYSPTFYATGLRSPDGLAFDPDGVLYVVEERASRVSRIEPDGGTTPVLTGLNSPEGITFDDAGNLYVVEDARRGRLLRRSPDGQVTTLAADLRAPEGVAVRPGPTGAPAQIVYVTESNTQFVRNPSDLETGVTAISARGDVTRVITNTPTLKGATVAFWSYAGLTAGPGGRLYVTNELSGKEINRRIRLIPDRLTFRATLFTEDSIFAVDPVKRTRKRVASGLLSPEGLSFAADGGYPLYVAEERVGYKGRLSRVDRHGRRTTVCSSFRGIEDVTVDDSGNLYASEDISGNVIRIEVSEPVDGAPDAPHPAPDPTSGNASRRAPDFRSLSVDLVRRLWRRLATLARWMTGLLRANRRSDAPPAGRPSTVQDGTTLSAASPGSGAHVVVRNTGGQGLRCRGEPGLEAGIVSRLGEGTTARLLDGPVQQDGYAWWQVEPPGGEPCWAAGDWLDPAED